MPNPLVLYNDSLLTPTFKSEPIPEHIGFVGENYFQVHCVGLNEWDDSTYRIWIKSDNDAPKNHQLSSKPKEIQFDITLDGESIELIKEGETAPSTSCQITVQYQDGEIALKSDIETYSSSQVLSGNSHQIQISPSVIEVDAEYKYGQSEFDKNSTSGVSEWLKNPIITVCNVKSDNLPDWIRKQDSNSGAILNIDENTSKEREAIISFYLEYSSSEPIRFINLKITQDCLREVKFNSFTLKDNDGVGKDNDSVVPLTLNYSTFDTTDAVLCTMEKVGLINLSKSLGSGIDEIEITADESNVSNSETSLGENADNLQIGDIYVIEWDEDDNMTITPFDGKDIELKYSFPLDYMLNFDGEVYPVKVNYGKCYIFIHHCYVQNQANTLSEWGKIENIERAANEIKGFGLRSIDTLIFITSISEANHTVYFPDFTLEDLQTVNGEHTVTSDGTTDASSSPIITNLPFFSELPSKDVSIEEENMEKLAEERVSYFRQSTSCKREFNMGVNFTLGSNENKIDVTDYTPLIIENHHAADCYLSIDETLREVTDTDVYSYHSYTLGASSPVDSGLYTSSVGEDGSTVITRLYHEIPTDEIMTVDVVGKSLALNETTSSSVEKILATFKIKHKPSTIKEHACSTITETIPIVIS